MIATAEENIKAGDRSILVFGSAYRLSTLTSIEPDGLAMNDARPAEAVEVLALYGEGEIDRPQPIDTIGAERPQDIGGDPCL